MKNLSNNNFLNILIVLLFLTVLAKFISVILLWFLPSKSEEFVYKSVKSMPYRSVNFKHLIKSSSHQKVQSIAPKKQDSIKNMILHGLYGNSEYGYAIVATKSNPKITEIISIGEKYKGYTLQRIALTYVVFTKNNKEYILELDESSSTKNEKIPTISIPQLQDIDTMHTVSRNEINYYVKNPSQIWKDISIQEIKQGKKIVGFKVTRVKKHSKMATLGLQRGDIIIKANGQALTSYRAAVKIYQNLNKLDEISLLIKRGNQEKELIYEIN